MSLQLYLAFVAACIALALLPGPMVTLVIANGLRHGTRAALTNIAGVQLGLAIVIGIVAVGLTTLMATMGYWFDWVRFAGAAYLVWLGIKLIRFAGRRHRCRCIAAAAARRIFPAGIAGAAEQPESAGVLRRLHSAVRGHEQDHASQVALLGITFMVIAGMTDALYALLAGRARRFSRRGGQRRCRASPAAS